MKITAELALSQVRRNKKRTMGTIFAIALSTALVTAVMCFATSGMKMLTDFFGEDGQEYVGMYRMLLVIPAAIFGLLIAVMSITVISNIFAASASKRLKEAGVLKCVGATKKQMKETVWYESLFVSLAGIPLGLCLGTGLGYAGVCIIGQYVEKMNDMAKTILMRPVSLALPFHVSVVTFIVSSVFSLSIVVFSAWKPAKKSGNLAAIQCIRGNLEEQLSETAAKDSRLMEKLLGYEGSLGYRNIRRNKSAYRPSIRALSLGIALLMMTGSLAMQAREIKDWMTPDSRDMLVDYCSILDREVNEETQREERRIVAPISSETGEEITRRLSEFGDMDVYGIGTDAETYRARISSDALTEEMKQAPGIFDERGEMRIEILTVDKKHYEMICDKIHVPYGSRLLINDYEYNDNGKIRRIVPFSEGLKEIELVNAAEETKLLTVDGILYPEDLPQNRFHEPNPWPVRIIVPEATVRFFDWYCALEDEQGFTEFARKVMDEYYPILTEDSYIEQGYTVRITREDTMAKLLNIAIVLAQAILYGVVLLLVTMGLASVIRTLKSNIQMRGREFAILKSIGMTNPALKKMLYSESIFCVGKAVVYGNIWGILIPYLINLALRKVFPVRYAFPWGMFFVSAAIMLGIVWWMTWREIKKRMGSNIIEEIRMDVM